MSGDAPVVEGFTVEQDPLTDEWVAMSPSGAYKLRGRSQSELEAARWEAYGRLVAEFRAASAELFPDQKISLQTPAQPLSLSDVTGVTPGCAGHSRRCAPEPPGPAAEDGTLAASGLPARRRGSPSGGLHGRRGAQRGQAPMCSPAAPTNPAVSG
jgi:hypothetical protein